VTPDEARRALEKLVSKSATERLAGLGRVAELVFDDAARPRLFALAAARDYAPSSALLVRLSAALADVDMPPRSRPNDAARALADAYAPHCSALIRVARTSKDPESARAAARIVAHFPERDGELEPLLLALVSGAADAVERAPLLYFLARIQLHRGATLHPRIVRAEDEEITHPEHVAVCLARVDAGEAHHGAEASLASLRDLGEAARALPDPRVWGRCLVL